MGLGNDTAAGVGMGGGVGWSPSSDAGSSGLASVGSSTSGDIPGVASSGVSGTNSGAGWMDSLGKILQDPQVMAALGQSMSKFGTMMASVKKLPPHVQDILKQAMQGGGKHQQVADQQDMNPYGGDMMKFITPDMARGVLDGMGIPYGRMR